MCTKCGEHPQSTRKGIQSGLCCNRCPNHGPWCSRHHVPEQSLHSCGQGQQPKATRQTAPLPASAKGGKRKAAGDQGQQQQATRQTDPLLASAKDGKRKAAGDTVQSASPQRNAPDGQGDTVQVESPQQQQKAQPKKKCKLTGQLRSIVKAMRDAQCVPKSFCSNLNASLSEQVTILSNEFGPLEQKAFGSYQQMKAFRTLNETLNSIETRKAEEVQRAEAMASQAAQELLDFEEVAANAEMEVAESTSEVEAKTSELSDSDLAVSMLQERMETLSSQAANDELAGDNTLQELSAAISSLNEANEKQQSCAEALAQAKLIQQTKTDALEQKFRLLPELRSVAVEVARTPSTARQQLEDFQKGAHASFQDIAFELVLLHGAGILGDVALGSQSAASIQKQPFEKENATSDEQQQMLKLGGA